MVTFYTRQAYYIPIILVNIVLCLITNIPQRMDETNTFAICYGGSLYKSNAKIKISYVVWVFNTNRDVWSVGCESTDLEESRTEALYGMLHSKHIPVNVSTIY